jgi:hypothetical protein
LSTTNPPPIARIDVGGKLKQVILGDKEHVAPSHYRYWLLNDPN